MQQAPRDPTAEQPYNPCMALASHSCCCHRCITSAACCACTPPPPKYMQAKITCTHAHTHLKPNDGAQPQAASTAAALQLSCVSDPCSPHIGVAVPDQPMTRACPPRLPLPTAGSIGAPDAVHMATAPLPTSPSTPTTPPQCRQRSTPPRNFSPHTALAMTAAPTATSC